MSLHHRDTITGDQPKRGRKVEQEVVLPGSAHSNHSCVAYSFLRSIFKRRAHLRRVDSESNHLGTGENISDGHCSSFLQTHDSPYQ